MFASRRPFHAALAAAAIVLGAACDDPTRIIDPPPSNAMVLFLVLDPDSASQPLLVQHAAQGELGALRATLAGSAVSTAGTELTDWVRCHRRYGSFVGEPRCLEFELQPEFGERYEVTVSADGMRTATAMTTVPEHFEIVSVSTTGSPPGSVELRANWRGSTGAYRYVVTIRHAGYTSCHPDPECNDRWFSVTSDTILTARIDGRYFTGTTGPYHVDVFAMNRQVYEYVMTGSGSEFFPVPPGQNVRGGYGGVGAWVIRSFPLP